MRALRGLGEERGGFGEAPNFGKEKMFDDQ
jgi:hypothetical protein